MAFHKSFSFKLILLVMILVAAVMLHPVWLAPAGTFLVHEEEPFQAEMVVVLAGGYAGNRILKGAELVQSGFAPRVLVSGPEGFYGAYESELAIPYALKKGYPAEWFISLPNKSTSTKEEAVDVVRELQRRNVRRFIIVTSTYHTRRAGEVYRDFAPGLEFRVVAAPDAAFPDEWWRSRQGQKTVFFEWSKTIAYWLGL